MWHYTSVKSIQRERQNRRCKYARRLIKNPCNLEPSAQGYDYILEFIQYHDAEYIQSSGIISDIISPSSMIRTTELSETTTATELVSLVMDAAAMCLLPRPSGKSIPFEEESR